MQVDLEQAAVVPAEAVGESPVVILTAPEPALADAVEIDTSPLAPSALPPD